MSSATTWSGIFDNVDEETARLIVASQLEDLEELAKDSDANTSPDQKVARQMYEAELKWYQENGEAAADKPIATSTPGASYPLTSGASNTLLSTSAVPPAAPPIATFRCAVCEDEFGAYHCWQAACKHYYCHKHIDSLFQHSLTDSALYPPSCCKQNIPFEAVKHLLNKDLAKNFADRKEELDEQNPTYCHKSSCSTYIGQSNKQGVTATCPHCLIATCILCKHAAHEGDCKQDDATTAVLELAQKEGWRRCPKCERMVELHIGCYHMTCLCKAQFCYMCGELWKTCRCPQFEIRRLFEPGQAAEEAEA